MERRPESIELLHAGINLKVDPVGAWIESMSHKGEEILYPRTEVTNNINGVEVKKYVGGIHPCLPQYGPDYSKQDLSRHGFARHAEWQMIDRSDKTITLQMPPYDTRYAKYPAGLEAIIDYRIEPSSFDVGLTTTLRVINSGDSPMPIAPAFHPYFRLRGDLQLRVGSNIETYADLTRFKEASERQMPSTFEASFGNGRSIIFQSEEMKAYYLWTDNPQEYVCLEPTSHGARFGQEGGSQILEPGELATYKYSMYMKTN